METRQSPDGIEDPRVVASDDVVRFVMPKALLIGSGRAMVTVVEPL